MTDTNEGKLRKLIEMHMGGQWVEVFDSLTAELEKVKKERDEARDIVDFNGDNWGESEFKLWDKIKKLEAENKDLKAKLEKTNDN